MTSGDQESGEGVKGLSRNKNTMQFHQGDLLPLSQLEDHGAGQGVPVTSWVIEERSGWEDTARLTTHKVITCLLVFPFERRRKNI